MKPFIHTISFGFHGPAIFCQLFFIFIGNLPHDERRKIYAGSHPIVARGHGKQRRRTFRMYSCERGMLLWAVGNNKVSSTNDPTAHAEVTAIRDACKNLGTFQLEDCEIYTSCEPCPMCLGAIYWARPKVVYYANNREDACEHRF
jgi:tRNA(Arg) A34 adenosine deaminase TadA